MERKWVIAAFLDLAGFRSWTSRASTAPEMKQAFLERFYAVLQCYVRKHPDVWSKYEGDGIMLVKEFTAQERNHGGPVKDFVRSLICLLKKTRQCIRESESCPEYVRVRAMDGYVFKLTVLDPNDPSRAVFIPEYVEYCINTVRGLLEVDPAKGLVVTKDLARRISRGRRPLRVRPLGQPSCYPKGINREDVDGLFVVGI